MPFKSKAQQRYLESNASPLSEGQKREWEKATDFKKLPARKGSSKGAVKGGGGMSAAISGRRK